MDPKPQEIQTPDPTAEVAQTPAEPVTDTALVEETTPTDNPAPVQDTPKTPEQEFLDAYNALCKEKGFELAFEIKPVFDGKIYDLTKVSIAYSVAKTK